MSRLLTVADAEVAPAGAKRQRIQPVLNGATILLGALLLSWPAIYNGFPLLYPDSMTYLDDGPKVARALILHQFCDYYGVRSLIYSLVILPFHRGISVWPVMALQCVLAAWVIWLVVRSVVSKRPGISYLALLSALALLTGLGWYASFIMPDILGPLLYLAAYLLVFARETLTKREGAGLFALIVLAASAHATHLMLAVALCLLLAASALLRQKSVRARFVLIGNLALALACAAALQVGLNAYLDGTPSLNGDQPPFLAARIVADGPGRWYLAGHCDRAQWTLCKHLHDFTEDAGDFLWAPNGVVEADAESDQQSIRHQEIPFVLAATAAYPAQQFARSAVNFERQLLAFGIYGFDSSNWMLAEFDAVMPPAKAGYIDSRQARDALPLERATAVQYWTVIGSLAVVVILIALRRGRLSGRLKGAALIVGSMVVGNAMLTGVLSMVDDRYGCRVIWMIPLLAGLLILDSLQKNERPTSS